MGVERGWVEWESRGGGVRNTRVDKVSLGTGGSDGSGNKVGGVRGMAGGTVGY